MQAESDNLHVKKASSEESSLEFIVNYKSFQRVVVLWINHKTNKKLWVLCTVGRTTQPHNSSGMLLVAADLNNHPPPSLPLKHALRVIVAAMEANQRKRKEVVSQSPLSFRLLQFNFPRVYKFKTQVRINCVQLFAVHSTSDRDRQNIWFQWDNDNKKQQQRVRQVREWRRCLDKTASSSRNFPHYVLFIPKLTYFVGCLLLR